MHRATPFSTSLRSYTAGGARSVVESVDDSKLMQEAKGNFAKGETRDSIESPQNYGFTSVCADGEKDKDGNLTMGPETFVSFPGGNRSFPAYGAMDDRRHRLKNLGKDAAKGSTAMFGLKEWGQQFLNTDTGMFMTGNKEKKMRFQLVENQNGKKEQEQQTRSGGSGGSSGSSGGAASAAALFEPPLPEPRRFRSASGVEFEVEVFQAPQVTPFADGGGGGGGGSSSGGSSGGGNGGQQEGGKSKPTGQKTLHKEKSDTYVDMTKDAVHTVRGKGNIKATDSNTHTYHEDESTSTRCDDGHVHIRKGIAKIWVSKGGCHSSVPITIIDCKDDGGGESQWTEGANPSAPSGPSGGALAYEIPLVVEAVGAQVSGALRFWMVRHAAAMSVDNTNVTGMDYTDLPTGVSMVQWSNGIGEIEYDDRPRLREVVTDLIPFAPFFDQFIAKLPGITLTQAQKIKCDLVKAIYDNKRQLPFAYAVAAGDYTWEATDDAVAGMAIATIPQIVQNLTGTSDSTVVGKINALVDEINTGIVTPGNQNKNAGNALASEINSDIATPVYNGFNSINVALGAVNTGVVTPVNSIVSEVNAQIISHLNTNVLGYAGDTINTINNKLQTGDIDIGGPVPVAKPGLNGNLPAMTALDVTSTAIGSNPHQVASMETIFPGTFVAVSYASMTADPSITPIQWTAIGEADLVTLTAVEMAGIMAGITNRRNNLWLTQSNKINAINALTSIVAVIAYDVTTGWPA